jgi:drug/metabolite transporter (DMT)-like permease
VPVTATLLGIPLTGEWPDAAQAAGLAVVVLGMALAVGLVRPRGAGGG